MKIIVTAFLSGILFFTATAGSATHALENLEKTIAGVQKYTCFFDQSNPYPDGTTGIAYTSVKITGKGETVVTVSYFSDNNKNYLGQYEEINGDVVPSNPNEACQFAFDHFNDRN